MSEWKRYSNYRSYRYIWHLSDMSGYFVAQELDGGNFMLINDNSAPGQQIGPDLPTLDAAKVLYVLTVAARR